MRRAAVLVPLLVFLGVYVTQAGHGFVGDDYRWVFDSRVRTAGDFGHLFVADNGFYRPVVALSFAVNEWMFGAAPLGYGITNIVLALACAAAVMWLIRGVGLTKGAAIFGALVWLMNFYFTKTAVLWISGRTALLVTLAGTLCAGALVRRRIGSALLLLALALLAKEEAVLLPPILVAWLVVLDDAVSRRRRTVIWIAGAAGVLALYVVARSFTGAMTPSSAPPYYHFTFAPAAVWRNVVEYTDRTSTLAAAATLVAMIVLGWRRDAANRRVVRVVAAGAIWLVVGLAFAYVLPVRSDLYAATPAVGSSLIAAAVASRMWSSASEAARRRALVVATAAAIALAPVYWLRTTRMAREAEFSAARLDELIALTRDLPSGARVRVDDVDSTDPHSPNLAAAFGSAIAEAISLGAGRQINAVLIRPGAVIDSPFDRHLRLEGGVVVDYR